jgi:fructose-1,6-bisphosphatase I
MTVEEFVTERAGAGLGGVLGAVAAAARLIQRKIRLAGLSDVYGAFGAVNVQGEQQQKLDVFANEALIEALSKVAGVAAIVSEEDEEPITLGHGSDGFAVVFDPLDGSSNIDVNVNVGTIFSVVRVRGDVMASVLKAGTEQVAAGYVVYGPSGAGALLLGE